MLAWRLLLATGEPGYADAIERAMYNGVLSGLSWSGTRVLLRQPAAAAHPPRRRAAPGTSERAPWQACACCPPNLMRLLSSWPQYLATSDDTGIQIHQYASADIERRRSPAPRRRLSVRTGYPWDGRVTVAHRADTATGRGRCRCGCPAGAATASLTVAGQAPARGRPPASCDELRAWRPGDRVVLDLDLPVRVTEPDPRVDAVRGCVAFERGPLVYCVESADLPDRRRAGGRPLGPGPASRSRCARPDLGEGVVGRRGAGRPGAGPRRRRAGAIPYYAWANRGRRRHAGVAPALSSAASAGGAARGRRRRWTRG